MKSIHCLAALAGASALSFGSTVPALAGVTLYTGDFGAWQNATGAYSTCDFVGFPVNTEITTQYSGLGATFTPYQGPNIVAPYSLVAYPQDGYGINGVGDVEILFDTPMHSLAAHAPGSWRYQLFAGNTMIYQSVYVGGSGYDFFAGVVSTVGFTKIRFDTFDFDSVFIDNVYFSSTPSPGALPAFALSWGFMRRRRRRE